MTAAARPAEDLRAVRWGILVTALAAGFGIVARFQIMLDGLARPGSANIFFRLYALYELPFLLLLALSATVAAVVFGRRPRSASTSRTWLDGLHSPSTISVAIVALLVFVVAVLTTHLVLHGFAFSMDEFSADFQARLFAAGRSEAALPAAWRPFADAITPIFVGYRAATGSWLSVYLPVYAFLKAPFVAVGAGTLLNPLLAAITIVALAGVARQLWPNEGLRPWVAIALLATSSEFVVTSGTAYSMPAHLCLNLVWLWLYLRGDARSWAAALVVGVLALGLHNPFPHALFVAPFLLRLLRDRRWQRVAWAAAVYGAGSLVWFAWIRAGYTLTSGGGGLLSLFALPNATVLWLHAINASLLFTWQAPLFGLLVITAAVQVRRLGPVLGDLALGVLITLVFYMFFPSTQGHGWGYRYAYQVLGSLALLAAAGVQPLRMALGARHTQLLVLGSLVAAIVVQLPVRLLETERFVRPFAAGVNYLMTRNADVVLVHGGSIWYGRDLVRNDPFLHGQPVIVGADRLTPARRLEIERAYPGRVMEVPDSDLLHLGMARWADHSF